MIYVILFLQFLEASFFLRSCYFLIKGAHCARTAPCGNVSFINLFERLLHRFRVHEVDVEHHSNAESAKNHVRLPLNIHESGRNEGGQSKVKLPQVLVYCFLKMGWLIIAFGFFTYAQFPTAARPTPLARYFKGRTSPQSIHAPGAHVAPKSDISQANEISATIDNPPYHL